MHYLLCSDSTTTQVLAAQKSDEQNQSHCRHLRPQSNCENSGPPLFETYEKFHEPLRAKNAGQYFMTTMKLNGLIFILLPAEGWVSLK